MSIARLALVVVAALVLLGAVGFGLVLYKDQTYVGSPPYAPVGTPRADVAVVYYSRSGHSEAVAREVARHYNARLARIAADYPRRFAGQRKASTDAQAKRLPEIRVEPLDLAPVRRLYLVAPTWWYRPATPLWAYVEKAALEGKEVYLLTTGNSRFRQAEIDAFGARIAARGGTLRRHVFLRRGRVFWQKSREELLAETRLHLGRLE